MFSFLLFWGIVYLIVIFLSIEISSSPGSKSFSFPSLIQRLWISRKVREKEEEQEDSKWKHLPDELMELIMERLCIHDYLALRKVCSPWRSIVTKALANKRCFPLPELPLVLMISKKGRITEQSFFNLKTEQELPKRSQFDSCHGSIEGWMIMMNRNENGSLSFFFFNPVTNCRISIKSQLHLSDPLIQASEPCMGKMVASSKPDCYNSDFFLAGLFRKKIAYYRHLDKSWNMIKIKDDWDFVDIEIVDSKLYVILLVVKNGLRVMVIYDLKDFGNGSRMPKVLALPPTEVTRRIENPPFFSFSGVMRHLAKHETLEQLFLIYITWSRTYKRNMFSEDRYPLEITAVDVFKLDVNKEPIEWIKCESLDDNAIFVGTGNSMVISRASLNSTQDSIGENSVYFALSLEYPMTCPEHRLGIKHLTDSDINYFSQEEPVNRILVPCWLRPSV